jgi:hypothetical protein
MIRGIGPIYASKLEVAFAAEVFELRELASERQREVPGIGKVRAGRIVQAWAVQQLVHPNREQQLHWSCLLAILLPVTRYSSCGLQLPLPTGLAVPGQAAQAPPQFIGKITTKLSLAMAPGLPGHPGFRLGVPGQRQGGSVHQHSPG